LYQVIIYLHNHQNFGKFQVNMLKGHCITRVWK